MFTGGRRTQAQAIRFVEEHFSVDETTCHHPGKTGIGSLGGHPTEIAAPIEKGGADVVAPQFSQPPGGDLAPAHHAPPGHQAIAHRLGGRIHGGFAGCYQQGSRYAFEHGSQSEETEEIRRNAE